MILIVVLVLFGSLAIFIGQGCWRMRRDRLHALAMERRIDECREHHLWPKRTLAWWVNTQLRSAITGWELRIRDLLVEKWGEPAHALLGLPLPPTADPEAARVLLRALQTKEIELLRHDRIEGAAEAIATDILAGKTVVEAFAPTLTEWEREWSDFVLAAAKKLDAERQAVTV